MYVCDYAGNCHDYTALFVVIVVVSALALFTVVLMDQERRRLANSIPAAAPDMDDINGRLDRIEQAVGGQQQPEVITQEAALPAPPPPPDPQVESIKNFLSIFNAPYVLRTREGVAVIFDPSTWFSGKTPPPRAELFLDDIFGDVRAIPGQDVGQNCIAGSHQIAMFIPGPNPATYAAITTFMPPETIRIGTADGVFLVWRIAESYPPQPAECYPITVVDRLRTAIAEAFGVVAVRWLPVFGIEPRVRVQAVNVRNVYAIKRIEKCLHNRLRELAAIKEQEEQEAQEAQEFAMAAPDVGIPQDEPRRAAPFRFAADVRASSTRWLWPDVIPLGEFTLFGGQPKRGKSQIAIALAATVSTGGSWPTGEPCQPGSVILMECEDPANRIRARIEAAGGNPSRIIIRDSSDGPLNLAGQDMALLEQTAAHLGNVRLVIISPLLAHFGNAGATDEATVRARLAPLTAWAARNQIAVMGITHPPKAGNNLFAGADGFRRAARAAFVAELDESDPSGRTRLFTCVASTDAEGDFNMRYTIDGVTLPSGVSTSRVRWLGLADAAAKDDIWQSGTTAQARSANLSSGRPAMKSAPAPVQDDWSPDDFLLSALADGPQFAADLLAEAEAFGFPERTIYDAKKRLGIVGERVGQLSRWSLAASGNVADCGSRAG